MKKETLEMIKKTVEKSVIAEKHKLEYRISQLEYKIESDRLYQYMNGINSFYEEELQKGEIQELKKQVKTIGYSAKITALHDILYNEIFQYNHGKITNFLELMNNMREIGTALNMEEEILVLVHFIFKQQLLINRVQEYHILDGDMKEELSWDFVTWRCFFAYKDVKRSKSIKWLEESLKGNEYFSMDIIYTAVLQYSQKEYMITIENKEVKMLWNEYVI